MILQTLELRVADYMSPSPITIQTSDNLMDAIDLMTENKIKRLILTKQGKVASIVTARDIVNAFQLSFSGEDL